MEQAHRFSTIHAVSVGIAIFTMFFGAGNLVYPIEIGMISGDHFISALGGFLATAVLLPLIGLITMVLFDGNYNAFFERLGGSLVRNIAIFISMMVIGPVIAIPRIVTLSHIMIAPFLPIPFLQTVTYASSAVFACLFLGVTFLAAFRESKLIALLGNIIGPIKVISLAFIIVKGCFAITNWHTIFNSKSLSNYQLFKYGFLEGFGTLDLLGAIFFSAIIIHLLRTSKEGRSVSRKEMTIFGLQASVIGAFLLAIFYTGLSLLGFWYGSSFVVGNNPGELFRKIAFEIMGTSGAVVIALTVVMACLSTSIALSAVFAEYLQKIMPYRLRFSMALAGGLLLCLPLSIFGLNTVLSVAAGPLIRIGYPALIALTFCNIAYKLFGFKWVRVPVVVVLLCALLNYVQ